MGFQILDGAYTWPPSSCSSRSGSCDEDISPLQSGSLIQRISSLCCSTLQQNDSRLCTEILLRKASQILLMEKSLFDDSFLDGHRVEKLEFNTGYKKDKGYLNPTISSFSKTKSTMKNSKIKTNVEKTKSKTYINDVYYSQAYLSFSSNEKSCKNRIKTNKLELRLCNDKILTVEENLPVQDSWSVPIPPQRKSSKVQMSFYSQKSADNSKNVPIDWFEVSQPIVQQISNLSIVRERSFFDGTDFDSPSNSS